MSAKWQKDVKGKNGVQKFYVSGVSTEELLKHVNDSNRKRGHKARAELKKRGVDWTATEES